MRRKGSTGKPRNPAIPEARQKTRTVFADPVEDWSRVTVVMFNRQIAYLDRLKAAVRLKTGKGITRAQFIRAFVDAVNESGLDLTSATSEEDVKGLMLSYLPAAR